MKMTGQNSLLRRLSGLVKELDSTEKNIWLAFTSFKGGIIKRTKSGKDVSFNQFQEYSEKYKIQKLKKKYVSYSGHPNLIMNFNMLGSIARKKIKNGMRMFFNNTTEERKANRHQKGLKGMPKRKFFGIDKKQQNEFFDKFRKKIKIRIG